MSIVLLQLKALSLDFHKHSFAKRILQPLSWQNPPLHGTKQGCEWGKCKIEKVFFVLPLLGGIPSVTIVVMLCYVAFLVLHRIRSFAFDMLGLRPLYRFQLRVL